MQYFCCPDARERAGPVFPPPPQGGGNTGPARSRASGQVLLYNYLDFIIIQPARISQGVVSKGNIATLLAGNGALFGHCSSCGFSISFASLGRFYEFETSPLCAGTGDDPKGHAGD